MRFLIIKGLGNSDNADTGILPAPGPSAVRSGCENEPKGRRNTTHRSSDEYQILADAMPPDDESLEDQPTAPPSPPARTITQPMQQQQQKSEEPKGEKDD